MARPIGAPEGYKLLCERPVRENGEQACGLGEDLQEMIQHLFR